TRRQPAQAAFQPGGGEGPGDVLTRFGEVRLALVMHGHKEGLGEGARGFDRFRGGEGQCGGSDFHHPRRTHEKQGHLNGKALADRGDPLVPDRVPRQVEGTGQRSRRQYKPRDRSTIAADRPVPRRCSGHPEAGTGWRWQVDRLPGDQTDRLIA
ncbi:MAG TPA: hypothetical protein VES89_04065, partial [Candidatus Competibacteraceae bacterium]|nr:hypothetical protein [Candidatus Competibacteraceae bacterium]